MENRRLLLAALLSAVVILAWQIAFPPAPPVRPEVVAPVDTSPPGEAPPVEAAGDAAEVTEGEAPVAEEPGLDFGAAEVAAESEARYVLEGSGVRAAFTNRGAQLESLRLAGDLDDHGEPIEMIRRRGTDPLPYAIVTGGNRSHRLNGSLFTVVEDTDEGGRPRLTFRHRSDRGAAQKVFSLDENGLLEATIALEGREEWGVLLGPGARELRPEDLDNRFLVRQASYRRGGETETVAVGDPKEDVVVPASGLRWVALEDSFFLAAAIPESGVREAVIRPIVQRR